METPPARPNEVKGAGNITSRIRLLPAHPPQHLPAIRTLFREYAASLEIDLCFQNFEQELADLPGRYAPPRGRLLLAVDADAIVGCVAIREIERDVCEMKRLYIRPAFRRHGAGRALASAVIDAAKQIGYTRMRLDTLASMKEAIALYETLGFQRIPAYYHNPSGCAVFMELRLR